MKTEVFYLTYKKELIKNEYDRGYLTALIGVTMGMKGVMEKAAPHALKGDTSAQSICTHCARSIKMVVQAMEDIAKKWPGAVNVRWEPYVDPAANAKTH